MWQFLEWWWTVPVAGAVVFVWLRFGWKAALAVLTLGASAAIYQKGRKDERARREQTDREFQENLQDGYDEIERRGADRDRVVNDLRDGKF
jgi:hypothetical protein